MNGWEPTTVTRELTVQLVAPGDGSRLAPRGPALRRGRPVRRARDVPHRPGRGRGVGLRPRAAHPRRAPPVRRRRRAGLAVLERRRRGRLHRPHLPRRRGVAAGADPRAGRLPRPHATPCARRARSASTSTSTAPSRPCSPLTSSRRVSRRPGARRRPVAAPAGHRGARRRRPRARRRAPPGRPARPTPRWPTSSRRSECAAPSVAARNASSTESPIARQASWIAYGIDSHHDVPGLQSVASASSTPASRSTAGVAPRLRPQRQGDGRQQHADDARRCHRPGVLGAHVLEVVGAGAAELGGQAGGAGAGDLLGVQPQAEPVRRRAAVRMRRASVDGEDALVAEDVAPAGAGRPQPRAGSRRPRRRSRRGRGPAGTTCAPR